MSGDPFKVTMHGSLSPLFHQEPWRLCSPYKLGTGRWWLSTQVRGQLWAYSHYLDGKSLAVSLSLLPFLPFFPLELETMGGAQGQGISNVSKPDREKERVL